MSQITVKNLTFSYPQSQKKVLDDVSFVIEKGSYTAIVGYNGSGKSSLARLICGLETPTSGSVEIAEGNKIGIVFQSPKNQIVSGIVHRDTAFAPSCQGYPKSEVELRTIESLNIVDMLSYAQNSTSALSLGQTQKIAISGTIAMRPEILILDEAVSMLDSVSRKEVLEFVKYWHKCGNTIIQITHDMQVLQEADNVIGIENGSLFFYGTKRAFLADENLVQRILLPPLLKAERGKSASEKILKKNVSLSLRNVEFQYSSDSKKILHDVNFDLHEGTLVALTGVSGAGKSTLLELCSGLLIYEGEIFCKSGKVALAQQNSSAALFETFAADDVAFGPSNYGIKGKELVQVVKKSMEDAGIPYEVFGERRTQELSGGEKRRLSIAGILALNTDVVFFDEPTSGLDCRTRMQVLNMLRNLAENGKTVLFSTHHQNEADFSDREIRIENGTVAYDSIAGDAVGEKKNRLEPLPYSKMLKSLNSLSLSLSGAKREKKSVIEKLPSALRLILFLALFVFSLVSKSLLWCTAVFVVSLVYCKLCSFKFKRLLNAAIKILPFLLFFSIFQIIFHPAQEGEIQFTTWKWFCVTPSKLLLCLESIIRTYSSLACISAFFVSMPEYDLIDSIKTVLSPLEKIKIPVRYLILIIEIIFRFIPLLVEEAVGIIKTQIIRGGFSSVNKNGKKSKNGLKAVIPLIVPLIIQTIRRSEYLADAITMRGFE